MLTQLEEWINLTKEVPLDPLLPICDPHHHLWDYPDYLPENLVRESARPTRHYLVEHFLKDATDSHNIVETVFIQCGSRYKKDGPKELQPVGETEFVESITSRSCSEQFGNIAVAAGIVGFADLTLGSGVARVLEAHLTASNRFRGIRFTTAWDGISNRNAPDLFSTLKFREGFAQLKKYNLSFDAWLYFFQLPTLLNLARAFPDTTIILDHIGGPFDIGSKTTKIEDVIRKWKNDISKLSTCPNVIVKLGGLGMPISGFNWHERTPPINSFELAEAMAPYYLYCIEKFGVDRCMFESNFPVDKWSYSYTVLWNAFKRIVNGFSPEGRASLFHDTAARIYRLPC
jgi:predicted TIM-barrel fold metal-dependent hydrolase